MYFPSYFIHYYLDEVTWENKDWRRKRTRNIRSEEKGFLYLEKGHWEWMLNFSSFDSIRNNVFANGYIQVAIHQCQELRNNLQHITWKKFQNLSWSSQFSSEITLNSSWTMFRRLNLFEIFYVDRLKNEGVFSSINSTKER